MRGARPLGGRGARRLTPHASGGHNPQSRGGGKLFQIRTQVIDPPFDQRLRRSTVRSPVSKISCMVPGDT